MIHFIQDYLKDNNTVIIPSLGALTITNQITGELMLMPFLKFDDGKLSGFISEKLGIEDLDAKKQIAEFVQNIHAELDKGNSFSMEKLGTFSKVNGEIEFTSWNSIVKSVEVEEKTIEPTSTIKSEEIVVNKEKTDIIEEKIEDSIVENTIQEVESSNIEDKIEETIEEDIKETFDEEIKTESAEYIKEPIVIEETSKIIEFTENNNFTYNSSATQTPKKKTKFVTIAASIAIIGGVAAAVYISFNSPTHNENTTQISENLLPNDSVDKSQSEVEETNPVSIHDLKKDQEKIEEEIKDHEKNQAEIEKQQKLDTEKERLAEEKAKKAKENSSKSISKPVVSNTSGKYHVIVGSFEDVNNANHYSNKLKKEGNNSKVIPNGNGSNMVSINSFSTMNEANEFRNTSSLKSWIYIK